MGSLPGSMDIPLIPFPPANVKEKILPDEWEACLDSWIFLAHTYLVLSEKAFGIKITKDPSLVQFLVSYAQNSVEAKDEKSKSLRRQCFVLAHRVFTQVKPVPAPLLEWEFLADMSLLYRQSKALSLLLRDAWNAGNLDENASVKGSKASLITLLEANDPSLDLERESPLSRTLALLRSCYHYGQFLMLGSDLMDAFSMAYEAQSSHALQKKIPILVYFSLMSLMDHEQPKISSLLDHLYSLKARAHQNSLIKAIIENTPLLQKMRTQITGPEKARATYLIDDLKGFEKRPSERPRSPIRPKSNKGKSKDRTGYGHVAFDEETHVHKMSLVTQIQELFPDLGSGFVIKLLDEYKDDTTQVTDHLLNDNLPPHLKTADRTEALPNGTSDPPHEFAANLTPNPTPPLLPTRRNIYDNDDFDRLAVSSSQVSLGRRNPDETADSLLSSKQPSSQKAAILSALAAFDSDDDERDDSYDVADVGGTVDTTNDDNAADLKEEMHEETLFNAYKMSPGAFNRDADTRRGKARAALKSETDMTDEAIEGWGIMVSRDPRRLKRLEVKFGMTGPSERRALEGTAWKGDSGTEGNVDSDAGDALGTRAGQSSGGRGRGRGGGRGRGSAGVAGPSDDKETQIARQRKDANKGSRANHNRRDQRARKMAKGGFPG